MEILKRKRNTDGGGIVHLKTFLEQLDAVMHGGFPLGAITELVGPSGIGKSQVGINASVTNKFILIMGSLHSLLCRFA